MTGERADDPAPGAFEDALDSLSASFAYFLRRRGAAASAAGVAAATGRAFEPPELNVEQGAARAAAAARRLAPGARFEPVDSARGAAELLCWRPFDADAFGVAEAIGGGQMLILGAASGGTASARRGVAVRFAGCAALFAWDAAGAACAGVLGDAHAILSRAASLGGGVDDAYRRWASEIENAELAARHFALARATAEARAFAARWLTDAAVAIPEDAPHSDAAFGMAHAANEFDAVAQLLDGLARDVLKSPDDAVTAERRAMAAGLLSTARRKEIAAAAQIAEALRAWSAA